LMMYYHDEKTEEDYEALRVAQSPDSVSEW
jgi:hypothetical protein